MSLPPIWMNIDQFMEFQKTGKFPDDGKPKAKAPKPLMNKTETLYAAELEARRLNREIESWTFEPFKLRLAKATYYSPDFLVVLPGGERYELHEVKGFWRDDARVKIKVAARLFPMFRFLAVQRERGAWITESF